MPVTAVIGAQWGDEGKGKIVDLLAQNANMVIRFSGGNNAGHTVLNELGEFKLHIIPAGIFNSGTRNIIGSGTVVHIPTLLEELKELSEKNISVDNLMISAKAHLVMPWHIWMDEAEEFRRTNAQKIGTTKRGMGPVFADKHARCGLRVGELLNLDYFRKHFEEVYNDKIRLLKYVYGYKQKLTAFSKLFDEFIAQAKPIKRFIADTERITWDYLDRDLNILLEGAQGVLLDIQHGTYPFCTSSNVGVGAAAEGSGIPPSYINEVIAVVKAYTTRIGPGAFPTRAEAENDEKLRELGREYGATTGRPRMCGWIDLPLLGYANHLNGFTSIAVTKLDILSNFDRIFVGTRYFERSSESHPYPLSHGDPFRVLNIDGIRAEYYEAPGWNIDISDIRDRADLPKEAEHYLRLIEIAAGAKAKFISVGPGREETIVC